jgi:LysR family hydrogen peroxide-inducible transcriptional activator
MSFATRSEGEPPPKRRARPDFRLLEIFLAVAENRSFAAVAKQMGCSQSAISQSVARLEDIVGGDLFERRRGAPVALTAIGRAILPSARSLIYTVDQQMSRAISTAQSQSGTLAVGFYPGIASGPLHDGIAAFARQSPNIQLRLVEGLPRELHRQLNERVIDIMFVALLPDLSSASLAQEGLWNEGFVIALREDHPLAATPTVRWHDVAGLPLIIRSSDGDLSGYRAILARAGEDALECELHDVSRGALLDMVRMGLGATVSFACAAVPRPGITYIPVVDDKAFATIEAVWPSADRNPIRHSLLSYVRKHVRGSQNLGQHGQSREG